jgi:hypothetical protein
MRPSAGACAGGKLWFKLIWRPLLEGFKDLNAKAETCKDVDPRSARLRADRG